MSAERFLGYVLGAVFAVAASAQSGADLEFARRVLNMSDAEQIAAVKAFLDEGMPVARVQGMYGLAMSHSALVLPVFEKKIEEVLRSPKPIDCFTDKNVNPDSVVDLAASMIAYGDGEPALKELAKLVALDEKRFGRMVDQGLSRAASHENGFRLAYKVFDPSNPALVRAIASWADSMLGGPMHPKGPLENWADALVEKYGGVPIGPEWETDPIASRLKAGMAESLRPEILRLAAAAWEKSPRRLQAMSQ